jgi:hypothetical protein
MSGVLRWLCVVTVCLLCQHTRFVLSTAAATASAAAGEPATPAPSKSSANLTDAFITLLLGEDGEAQIVDMLASRLAAAILATISDKLVSELTGKLKDLSAAASREGQEEADIPPPPQVANASAIPAQPAPGEEALPNCPSGITKLVRAAEHKSACLILYAWRHCDQAVQSFLSSKDVPSCDSLVLYEHGFDELCRSNVAVRDVFSMRCGFIQGHEEFWAEQSKAFWATQRW